MKKTLLFLLTFGICVSIHSQKILTDTIQLSEVEITAEKRVQRIQELPLSVSSISIKRIETEKAVTLRNISGLVPNFYMPEYGSKLTSPVYIRGIGSRINSPSVGLYVDRVPYFEKSAFAFNFADIERIEVLRGPQGTLYGRNTMGGIVNVITRVHRNYRELRLIADAGNFGIMNYKLMYNEPISDKLSIILNGGYSQHNGFFTNMYTNTRVGTDNTQNASVKIRFMPKKTLVLVYKLGGEKSNETGYPYSPLDSLNRVQDVNYNYKSGYKREMVDNSLTASLFLNKFTVTSVSAYQYLKDKQNIDQDFMPKDYYQVSQGVKQNQYSQEFVLSTTQTKYIDATIGVFGFFQDANREINLLYGSQSNEVKLVPGNGYVKNNDDENSGLAIFGQTTIKKIFNLFDITLGLRLDNEWNSLQYTHYTFQPTESTLKKDTLFKTFFSQLLPKFALRYIITDYTSAYFTTSKGYRGGGFNTTFARPEDQTYGAESSWNYETGMKSTLVPKILSASVALFYIDLDNQQVSQRVTTGGNMYKNAGKTYSRGFEFEFLYTPLKQLQLGGNMGYAEAKYIDFKPNLLDTINYKRNYLPFVPRYTYAGFVGYKHELGSILFKSVFVNVSTQGVGKQFWNDANTQTQKAYTIVNGSIGIETRWLTISVWSKNLFNTDYNPYVFYIDQFKKWYAQKGNPFTIGISLSLNISETYN